MADNQQYNNARRSQRPHPSAIELTGIKPPSDEATEAVLGALLTAKDAYTGVCDTLRPEVFYNPAHKLIYRGHTDPRCRSAAYRLHYGNQSAREERYPRKEPVAVPLHHRTYQHNIGSAAHIEYHAKS